MFSMSLKYIVDLCRYSGGRSCTIYSCHHSNRGCPHKHSRYVSVLLFNRHNQSAEGTSLLLECLSSLSSNGTSSMVFIFNLIFFQYKLINLRFL